MTEEARLLRDYVDRQSHDSFARIVERYVDLVYAAARRQVLDATLAEDVTQAVFMIRAQKAPRLRADRPLAGWLLRVTAYAAANARRARSRQRRHERRAAAMKQTVTDGGAERWTEWSPLAATGAETTIVATRNAVPRSGPGQEDIHLVAAEGNETSKTWPRMAATAAA